MSELVKSNIAVGRTAEQIAAEINDIKVKTYRMVLYNSIEIGRRLVEAKELVPYGEWGHWLEVSVEYSKSTANNLMKVFQEFGADQMSLLSDNNLKSQAFGNLTYSKAVALFAIPEEEREEFVKENKVDDISSRELQKLIKERDDALKRAEAFKKAADKNNESAIKAKNELKELKETIKNEKEDFEKERDTLHDVIKDISNKLKEAQELGDNAEAERLQEALDITTNELNNANSKVEELEKQLKEKPIEVVAQLPEELIKYRVLFKNLVSQFDELISTLDDIENEEDREKYKNSTLGLLNRMIESLQG